MQLVLHRPWADIFPIVTKALEEEEEYEYIPIEPLEPKGAGGPWKHSTPKRREEPAATALAEQLKTMTTQELQNIMSSP